MIRILTLELLLFLLPFIVYGAWWLGTRRNTPSVEGEAANDSFVAHLFETTRSRWLAGIGILLMSAFIVFLSLTGGHPPDGTYVAPKMVDGVIVPGHFIDPEEADDQATQEDPDQ